MKVHTQAGDLPRFRNAALTIGTFDGVHTGHRQIIRQLKDEAAHVNGESVILSFHPHPRMVVNNGGGAGEKILLLNTLEEKIALIEEQGVDHLVVVPFTEDFSRQTAAEYLEHFLVEQFQPKRIIIGYDHHFGKNRSGNFRLLEQYAGQFGYEVKEIPEHVLHHVTISSTKIRNALLSADIATANEFLGYNYFFSGKVVEGNKLGRTIGYPTANIEIEDKNKLIPANGVYAVTARIDDEGAIHKGMMNIGLRPTIGIYPRTIEVNLFNFDQVIYNRRITIFIHAFLREEQKFAGLEPLKEQLATDKANSLKVLEGISR